MAFRKRQQIEQVVKELGYATQEQIDDVLEEQERQRKELGEAPKLGMLMVDMGILSIAQLAEVLNCAGIDDLRISEDAFQLANRLEKVTGGGKGVILIAGSRSEPVVPDLVRQMGIAFALIGDQAVLVIDADMRHPRLSQYFQLPAAPGLSNILLGSCGQSESIVTTGVNRLHILSAGGRITDPLPLLMARDFALLVDNLRKDFGLIIINAPPILEYTDASIIGSCADGVVIPITRGERSKGDVRESCKIFEGIGLPILGSVLCEP